MRPSINALERDLRRQLRGDVEFDSFTRHLYATDAGLYQITPIGVVSPRDTEDLLALVAYATENGVPLVPRGAGSGLAGAAVGPGLQVDFTRHMNKILEVAEDGSWARVQPGVVMGLLNAHVKAYGTFFAPNPSSENYCTLGGMMANNSSGSRSVAYGMTIDHVLGLRMALSGGELFDAGTVARNGDLARLVGGSGGPASAFSRILPLLESKGDAIRRAQPHVMKNASGYRLETVIEDGRVNLQKLFVGSEGSLGLIAEATLNLVPLPGKRAIAMAYFPGVRAAGEAVFPILDLKPTSLEIMDSNFLTFVRTQLPKLDAMLPAGANTALLIEFEGADTDELDERLRSLESLLAGGPAVEVKRALDPVEQEELWQVRKTAVPLLQKLPGPKRIAEVIEDVTIHPSVLADYMENLDGMLKGMDIPGIMYGHAGDGNVHTRPLLDLKDAKDLAKMQRLLEEVVEMVLELRGTPSGEHGDGLVRTPLIPLVYGEEVYGVFQEVKDALDPTGIMNPGKKILQPGIGGGAAQNMRYGADYWTYDQSTVLAWENGAYQAEVEKCHGCAQCKSLVATTMCPTYKALKREHASPRAKANVLRNILSGRLDPESTHADQELKLITDYCIECGMCAVECPSNVNIPKLMLEAKARYRDAHPGSATDRLLGDPERLSKTGSSTAAVSGRLANHKLLRKVAEGVTGIDRRRTMPPFAAKTFAQRLKERDAGALGKAFPRGEAASAASVAFFYDLYANYHDPSLAECMEALLLAHGIEVTFPDQQASGIPEMLYGYREKAWQAAARNVIGAKAAVEGGALLVSGEPTATLAFKEHYNDYLGTESPEGQAAAVVAAATRDLGEFLAKFRADHPERSPQPRRVEMKAAYHLPCHLKAQKPGAAFLDLLREVPGLEVADLNAGCCGMAGTFGMKRDTYELSMDCGRPLFERVAEVQPEVILTECSTCRMQLEDGTGLKAIHPARILCQAYAVDQGR